MATVYSRSTGATYCASAPPGFPNSPGWTIKVGFGDHVHIMARHGLRTIARDVRSDEAATIVAAVNAHHDLINALRNAAGWLEAVGQHYNIAVVTEAAEQARALLQGVQA